MDKQYQFSIDGKWRGNVYAFEPYNSGHNTQHLELRPVEPHEYDESKKKTNIACTSVQIVHSIRSSGYVDLRYGCNSIRERLAKEYRPSLNKILLILCVNHRQGENRRTYSSATIL